MVKKHPNNGCLFSSGAGSDWDGHEETLWDSGNLLAFDSCLGYSCVHLPKSI